MKLPILQLALSFSGSSVTVTLPACSASWLLPAELRDSCLLSSRIIACWAACFVPAQLLDYCLLSCVIPACSAPGVLSAGLQDSCGDGFIVCAFRKRLFQRYVKRGLISGIPQLQQVWKSIETKQELIHLSSKKVQIRCFGDYKIPVCDEWIDEKMNFSP